MLRQQSQTRQAEGRQQDSALPVPTVASPLIGHSVRGFDGAASGRAAANQPTVGTTIMRSPNFWSWFDGIAGPQLAHRTEGFRKVFDHLDRFDRPVGIVETGCVRRQDNWAGDGQSTILFDRYAEFHPRSAVFSVDRDPEAAALCRSLLESTSLWLRTPEAPSSASCRRPPCRGQTASAHRSRCRATVRGAAVHRPDQAGVTPRQRCQRSKGIAEPTVRIPLSSIGESQPYSPSR